jgi:hypothetical protein
MRLPFAKFESGAPLAPATACFQSGSITVAPVQDADFHILCFCEVADMRFKLEVADQLQRLYEARKEVSSSLEDLIQTSGTIISHRNSISSTEIADIGLSVAHSDLALSKAIVEIMKVKAALAAIGYEQAGGDLSTIQWDNKDYL